ncbi:MULTISPECIES: phosphoenolpyruvate carboxylase [Alteromonas]|mgnify:FL=1|uniref:Phosphoenolpyruvate carboxylase n=1 Tax=Alteromonas hispanica TaxID=315421 RepID=A0A6L9MRS5_9ALTE|nr:MULTISPECIES: phosphoenolpyruvate carboxylase [Alteromonas]APE05775.1 phosphoenolpyruvate carboxylase [Alteromonas sp. RW2A1]NDW20846.1 phosphoenolpyruvate carboxylase [Alteromonas hispanica]
MSQVLLQAGTKLLNALGRHSDLIMQAYINGSVKERDHSSKVLEQLVQLGVLWRPEAQSELRLKSAVRTLLEGSLQDERNRTINANVGASLASLKTLTEHYKEALHYNKFNEAAAHMSDLTEHVYQLSETLSNSVRVMFSRINNEFGYVSSVDAKIRENELAQKQVTDLLAQLECFRFDELSEIAGSNRELRHLLVVSLQQRFSKAAQELSVVQARLLDLLGRFREFQGRTRLLKGFLLHVEQQPDFAPGNYANLTNVPVLFNQSASIIGHAAADVNNVAQEQDYQEMVATLTHIHKKRATVDEGKPYDINVTEQETLSLVKDPLQHAVEAYFCDVIDSGQPKTALDYFEEQQLEFDPEVWLYQVIGGYQALGEEEKQFFALEPHGKNDQVYTGNFYISDITLGLR